MKLLKRVIATMLIAILVFSDAAVPVYAQTPSSETQDRPLKKAIAKLSAKPSLTVDVLGLADNRSGQHSARQRVPIKLEKLERTEFKATETVNLTLTNPDKVAIETKVVNTEGEELPVTINTVSNGIVTELEIDPSNQFTPGKYTIEIKDGTGQTLKQDFAWGVLALNTDKSVYTPHETAAISIAVLNDLGQMVCDAKTDLRIVNKTTNEEKLLSTTDGTIIINDDCHSKAFTLKPDYEAKFTFANVGEYDLVLSAETQNGTHTITEPIEVKESVPFSIKRTSATRLYPPLNYPMHIEITANQDFEGTVTETVPDSFTITPSEENTSYDGLKTLYLDGKNPEAGVLGAQSLQMPFDGSYTLTQGFGTAMTDLGLSKFYASFGLSGHDGIDFALPTGTPLYAVDNGNIIWSGPGDYGITVIIEHSWGRSYYGHLSKTNLGTGYTVKKGELLGYSGNTGESTGPHLHFGMKPTNPDLTNGYSGKIDPAPYLSGLQMVPEAFTRAINSSGVLSATISPDDHNHASVSAVESASEPQKEAPKPAEGYGVDDIVPFAKSSPPSTSTAELRQEATKIAPGVKAEEFTLLNQEIQKEVAGSESMTTEKVKVLKWNVSLKKGERTTLSYTYKAPQVSPQFYLLGTVNMFDKNQESIYEEASKWQLAADDIGAHWYDLSWRFRKTLTIDNTRVNATLTNFPVLVSLTSDADLSADAQADGDDILFTDSTGQTKLDHEIESYSSGTLVAWVEVPTVADATDTDIYMYYGNSSASSQQSPTGTWNTAYQGVWHLNQDPTGTAPQELDSTSNNNDLTATGTWASTDDISAKIGTGLQFRTTAAMLIDPDASTGLNPSGDMTVSGWINSSVADYHPLVYNANVASPFHSFELIFDGAAGNGPYFGYHNSTGTRAESQYTGGALSAGTWYYIVGQRSSNTIQGYLNGSTTNFASATTSGVGLDPDADFIIANSYSTYTTRTVDEVRFSNSARGSGWISSEYNNQNSPATFYSVGGEETRAYAPLPSEQMRHGKYFDTIAGGEQPFVY